MRIRWLHLSDIHFNYRNFDSRLLRKDFIKRIKKMGESEGFTHLFLTGDILDKYNTSNDASEETVRFVNDLISAMGVEYRNVYIIPGNHDHNRDLTIELTNDTFSDPGDDKCICRKIGDFNTTQLNGLMHSFEKFNDIYKSLFKCDYFTNGENPHIIIDHNDISVIKINTAWLDTDSDSNENIYCDTDRLLTLFENNIDLLSKGINIAIGHHPLEGLASEEKTRLLALFGRFNVGLYFCGHVHQPSTMCYN